MLTTYLVDANIIRSLSYSDIEKFCKEYQVITVNEVYREVAGLDKASLPSVVDLNAIAYEKVAELLDQFECVRKLISYYENKGAADVCILAYLLTANSGRLIPDRYILVTNDGDLIKACVELKIEHTRLDGIKHFLV